MTSTRRAALAATLLSASLVLAACGGGDEGPVAEPAAPSATGTPGGTRTVQADNGAIQVAAAPQRVVAIGNASLPYIDLGGVPIGVTTISASMLELLPPEQQTTYRAATNLGLSGGEVDLEKLASLKPDLILAQFPSGDFDQLKGQLSSIAPTAYFGLGTEWKILADRFAEAGNITASLNAQKAEFADRIAKLKDTYRAVIEKTSFATLDRYVQSEPATFVITDIGCVEIAKADVGLRLPDSEGNGKTQSFEQIGALSTYDAILYPVDAAGRPTAPFAPVVETNVWKALPAVTSGRALGVFCPGNNSYGSVLRYLDSLDRALATLSTKE